MTSWVRLWHDMPTDPKFRTIARAAKQPLPTVVAIFTYLLADASANESERGRTTATDEDIASAFDLEESDVVAIKKAMQGRVLDGDMLAGWEKRQPKKEDNSAERARAWRAQKQAEAAAERERTIANASERPDTEVDTDTERKKAPLTPQEGGEEVFSKKVWEVFPRHINSTRSDALLEWTKLSQGEQASCVSGIAAYRVQHDKAASAGRNPIPKKLSTWIAKRGWEGLAGDAPPDVVTIPAGSQDIDLLRAFLGNRLVLSKAGNATVRIEDLERARSAA